jgi:uncharacterized membrane protein (DUF485 family)
MVPLDRSGEGNMAASSLEEIQNNPKYQQLVTTRATLGRTLSIIVMIIYFGFILLVAFLPGFLGASLAGGVTTIGILVGVLVIVSAFLLTGFYVSRANSSYDTLTQQIIQETQK